MWPFALAIVVALAARCDAMDNLNVAFQWRQLDFAFTSDQHRQDAIAKGEFVQENNLPLGLEVHDERVFITVPRWKSGVAASLTYIKLSDSMDSPKLHPYPNWEAHKLPTSAGSDPPEIVSPFRIRADQCGRLWVLDTGVADLLGDTKVYSSASLLVYDLHNDALLRRYQIPKEQVKDESFLANIAVEDTNCDDSYAYLGDLGAAGLIVYSWKKQTSWRIVHNYFNMDPTAGEFNVSGISFQWTDALFGLGLSAPGQDGFSTLYFHPMCSTNEFSVNTKYLRDEESKDSKDNFHQYKLLGSRGPNAQSSVSFLDKNTGVLFYALLNLNAIACWKTTNPSYTMQSQGRVFMSNVSMVFPNDIKVDAKGNLWVLSDRLSTFMYSRLDVKDVNFRILTATVSDAIRGTACDAKLVIPPKMKDKGTNEIGGASGESTSPATCHVNVVLNLFLLIVMMIWK